MMSNRIFLYPYKEKRLDTCDNLLYNDEANLTISEIKMNKEYLFAIRKADDSLVMRTNDINVCRAALDELMKSSYVEYLPRAVEFAEKLRDYFGLSPEDIQRMMDDGEFQHWALNPDIYISETLQ